MQSAPLYIINYV